MDLSPRILGGTVARFLTERAAAPLLTIGSDTFDRRALSTVACFNFAAAANLSQILKTLNVKNTRDVFDNVAPWDLALPRLGPISLAVLGAAFEHKQLGGASPLEAWVIKHRNPDQKRDEFVTFTTMKHKHDALERTRTRPRRRK